VTSSSSNDDYHSLSDPTRRVSALSSQKYEVRTSKVNAGAKKRSSAVAALLGDSPGKGTTGPLLSVHEFLGSLLEPHLQGDIEAKPDHSTIVSDVPKVQLHPSSDIEQVSQIDTRMDKSEGVLEQDGYPVPLPALTASRPQTSARNQVFLDLTEDQDEPSTATDLHETKQAIRNRLSPVPQIDIHDRHLDEVEDLTFSDDESDDFVLPLQNSAVTHRHSSRGDGGAPPMAGRDDFDDYPDNADVVASMRERPSTPKTLGAERFVQKLTSEEEMRTKIPTPIPSPATSRLGRFSETTASTRDPPYRPASSTPVFGMPSIIRSPQKSTHQTSGVSSSPSQSLNTSMSSPKSSHAQSSRPKLESRNAEEAKSRRRSWLSSATPASTWTSEDPAAQLASGPGASSTPASGATVSRSNKVFSSAFQAPRAPRMTLGPAFGSNSSTSSLQHMQHVYTESEPDDYGSGATDPFPHVHVSSEEQADDPDAAPSPPDIARYPRSRRATTRSEHRLSSMNRFTQRIVPLRKTDPEPDDGLDTIVRTLSVRPRSRSEVSAPQAGGNGLEAEKASGIARLEAMISKAEQDRANRSVKGLWRRFRRRMQG
jgi:hypothetical protein